MGFATAELSLQIVALLSLQMFFPPDFLIFVDGAAQLTARRAGHSIALSTSGRDAKGRKFAYGTGEASGRVVRGRKA